jgi:hypothetical protein
MAFRHGSNCEISIDGDPLTAYCDKLDTNIDRDVAEVDVFSVDWKANLAGHLSGSFDISGSYDPTAGTGPQAVLLALYESSDPVVGLFYPGGNVADQLLYTANVHLTGYKESAPVGGQVTFTASFVADGEITPSIVGA